MPLSRRAFLGWLGVGAGSLLLPSTKRFFLPPIAGWFRDPYVRVSIGASRDAALAMFGTSDRSAAVAFARELGLEPREDPLGGAIEFNFEGRTTGFETEIEVRRERLFDLTGGARTYRIPVATPQRAILDVEHDRYSHETRFDALEIKRL